MNNERIRLHKHLFQLISLNQELDYTRPEIQRNIANYGVKIDGNMIYNRLEWVYPSQSIDFSFWPQRNTQNFSEVKIVFENNHCCVLYKPAGVVVMEGAGHKKENLITWISQKYPRLVHEFDSRQHPFAGLVHRLDKPTQGLLLLAKTPVSLEYYQNLFRSRKITKQYLAVVNGIFNSQIECKSWQFRDPHNPIKQKLYWNEDEAFAESDQARFAHSLFQPVYTCKESNQSLVLVRIYTGRMHQIRLQSQELGFPIVNDTVYSTLGKTPPQTISPDFEQKTFVHDIDLTGFNKVTKQIFGEDTLCLLSNRLEFVDIDNTTVSVELFSQEVISHLL